MGLTPQDLDNGLLLGARESGGGCGHAVPIARFIPFVSRTPTSKNAATREHDQGVRHPSYAHRDRERANNPPVGLVTPDTAS